MLSKLDLTLELVSTLPPGLSAFRIGAVARWTPGIFRKVVHEVLDSRCTLTQLQ